MAEKGDGSQICSAGRTGWGGLGRESTRCLWEAERWAQPGQWATWGKFLEVYVCCGAG